MGQAASAWLVSGFLTIQSILHRRNMDMKKWTLALAALLAVAALPVSAANNEVLNGTPEIDGVMDEIYTQSACIELENFGFYTNGSTSAAADAVKGTKAWYLWDEDNIYVYAEIVDNTTSAYDKSVDYTGWSTCDNLEGHIWTSLTGGEADDRCGLHVGALGEGITTGGPWGDAKITAVGTQTDTGYALEFAINLLDTDLTLKEGVEFNWGLQYNNFIPDDGACVASGYQAKDQAAVITLSAEKVEVETEPETVADVAADVADTQTTAPATFDAGIAAVIAMVTAAGGYAVAKKREH